MCTAIRFDNRLFGRTFDYERSYGEMITVLPRGHLCAEGDNASYAILGIGVMRGRLPLLFDGVNECGLAGAALSFPKCAVYHSATSGRRPVASGCLLGLILGRCSSVLEVRKMLSDICVIDGRDPTPLHWMFCDSEGAIVVESVADGLNVMNNPAGVLTNSPELGYHLTRLGDISLLGSENPSDGFCDAPLYSRGMGAIGLPGDFSSSSRFLRAAFLRKHCPMRYHGNDYGNIRQAMDLMGQVSLPHGAVLSDDGREVYTRYTAVIDMTVPAYYLSSSTSRAIGRICLSESLCEGGGVTTAPIYINERFFDI